MGVHHAARQLQIYGDRRAHVRAQTLRAAHFCNTSAVIVPMVDVGRVLVLVLERLVLVQV